MQPEKNANVLRSYLCGKNMNGLFEQLGSTELALVLEQFWLDIRKPDRTLYRSTSMDRIRNGLRSPPFMYRFDIIKDREFQQANLNF